MEFCPGIYEHAAAMIGRHPGDVSRSRELLAAAHGEAWRRYGQRLVVVGIDVYNIEAEALGAVVGEPLDNSVPAIVAHPLPHVRDLAGLPGFDPDAGRIPLVLEAAKDLVSVCEGAEVRVPVCGPLALANGLLGMENLLVGLMEDPERAVEVLSGLMAHQTGYLEAIRDAGVHPLFFESGVTPPLLSVPMFEEIEAPLLRRIFDAAAAIFGQRPPCIIGGDAAPMARTLLQTGPGYVIAPSETDQAAFLTAATAHPEIHVRVNMPATRLASAAWTELESDALRALALARTRGNTSVGCGVVPFETDPARLVRLRDFIQQQPTAP
jgi:uroporphyrinogen decarboxylase